MEYIKVAKSTMTEGADAKIPTRGSKEAAGWDLYSSENIVVPARGKAIIPTGIHIAIPYGYYGRVAPRSGMSWKKHRDIGAGVIDSDYRGTIGVVMFNHGEQDLHIDLHDRVAQLVIEKINTNEIKEVNLNDLNNTDRGEGAFGSTGI